MTRKSKNRYDPGSGAESETQPGSRGRILRNLLGVTGKRRMDLLEFEALVWAQEDYAKHHIADRTRFTARLLRQMHKDWLGSIYPWAGEYRSVNIAKGGFAWPPAHLVPAHMRHFEAKALRDNTPCRPASAPEVAGRMAIVHAELLLIHPFRDENGRLARWLADLMALQAGLPPPLYAFSGRGCMKRRERYLQAVQRGYLEEHQELADFFTEAIERRL